MKTLRDDRRPPKAFGVGGTKKGAGDARRICFWKVFGRFLAKMSFFELGGRSRELKRAPVFKSRFFFEDRNFLKPQKQCLYGKESHQRANSCPTIPKTVHISGIRLFFTRQNELRISENRQARRVIWTRISAKMSFVKRSRKLQGEGETMNRHHPSHNGCNLDFSKVLPWAAWAGRSGS